MEPLFEENFDELIATAWERFFSVLPGAPQYQGNEVFTAAYGTVFTAGARSEFSEAQILYNPENNQPYEMTVRPFAEKYSYRWVHPAFDNHRNETVGYDNPTLRFDHQREELWVDTQSIDDILMKIGVTMLGGETDGKVSVILDLDEAARENIGKLAERAGVSFDEMVETLLRRELKKIDKKAFPKKKKSKDSGVDKP